jgi:alcohol dehydrogenase class IV
VVSDPENQTKTGIWDSHVVSQYAIVDAELTIGMPDHLTADTGLDALIHAIEAYTARTTNPIARMYARESIRLVVKHLPKAVKEGNDLEARLGMSLAATLAGLAFSNGGLGGAHALNLPLDSKKHIPHGRTVAILAPWVMDFNRKGNETVYAEIASLMGEEVDKADIPSASQKAVNGLIKFMESVGISPYLTDHGIKAEEINELAKEAFRVGQRLLVFNPRDVTEDDVIKIYQAAAEK